MREIWRELFDDVVFATTRVIHGDDATNTVLRNVVQQALLAQCIDQKIREALDQAVSQALDAEHST